MTHEHRGVATHLVAYDLPDAQPARQCSNITVHSVREHRPDDVSGTWRSARRRRSSGAGLADGPEQDSSVRAEGVPLHPLVTRPSTRRSVS